MPDPQVYAAITKYRNALIKAESASAERLINAYATLFKKLNDDIRALEADILDMGDTVSTAKVKRLERYQDLIQQTTAQMTKYAAMLESEVATLQAQAIEQALNQNKSLVQAALPNLPKAIREQITANFNRLDPQAIESLLGALSKDSPLTTLLNSFGETAAQQIGDVILQGVGLGYNPRKVAARIVENMGGNLSRALTIARTEQLRAYRTATLSNYAANSDVVKGWKWSAAFDKRTCLACLSLDGQEFALSESFMKSHPNCRCAPTPITITYKDLGLNVPESPSRQTGKQWFGTLSDTDKAGFFSKAAFKAYKAGAVELDDFVGQSKSKVWGDSYMEKSLKDILGNDASKYAN